MMPAMHQPPTIDDAARRSGVVWVDLGRGPQVAWHLWHDGALWLVCGGREQDLPGSGTAERAVVSIRSKQTQNDVVARFEAQVSRVEPGSKAWTSVVPLLHEKRLNPPDGEAQPDRWARESLVLRLSPTQPRLTGRSPVS